MLLDVKLDSRLFFIGAGRTIGKRSCTRVLPQGLERFLKLTEAHIGAQLHLTMNMDLKRSVVM